MPQAQRPCLWRSLAFAAAIGLLIYPQIADVEHFEPRGESGMLAAGGDGYFARVGRWIKESF